MMRTPEQIAARVAARLSSDDPSAELIAEVDPRTQDLVITANFAGRERIEDLQRHEGSNNILYHLFEEYSQNGSFEPFDAGQGNPNVGLTDAPCIAEEMTLEDDGKRVIEGRFWYYANYMITDPMDELRKHGIVVFTLAPT